MYPRLLPGLHPLRRDKRTIQLGLKSERSLLIDDPEGTAGSILRRFDGYHSVGDICRRTGANRVHVEDLMILLARFGFVHTSGSLASQDPHVILGTDDEMNSLLENLLAGCGIKTVPLGTKRRMRRTSRPKPQLVVIPQILAASQRPTLKSVEIPHLALSVYDRRATIGPLVIRGTTACLRCIHLHRCDRDSAWPVLAMQLAEDVAPTPHQRVLASAAAAIATTHIMQFLESGTSKAIGVSFELDEDGAHLRKRTWEPHPHCGCI